MLCSLAHPNPLQGHNAYMRPPVINTTMIPRMPALLLLLAATVYMSSAETNNGNNDNKQQSSNWDEPIKFSTKAKDSCAMVTSAVGNYTRLRVSCKGQSQGQTPGRSYYCDFQGKPSLCRAYNSNPRHYFTQMMWELRKLNHACQGPKIYRPQMCKKSADEAQMTFLASWPKTSIPKHPKPAQDTRKPVVPPQTKPATTPKPVKPQPGKEKKKPTPKPVKTTTGPTELPDTTASRLASEYCWKSLQGICTHIISWFQQ